MNRPSKEVKSRKSAKTLGKLKVAEEAAPVAQSRPKATTVDVASLPQYDLSKVPDEFRHLLHNTDSRPKQWADALAKRLGRQHVINLGQAGDKWRVENNNKFLDLYESTERKAYHATQKKRWLNALVHLGVFGRPRVKE